jgi:divalent metal cation (Fe/Co/Zn/Cd) transporter
VNEIDIHKLTAVLDHLNNRIDQQNRFIHFLLSVGGYTIEELHELNKLIEEIKDEHNVKDMLNRMLGK